MVGCSAALSRRALNDNTLSADTLMTTKPQHDSSTTGPHCPARQLQATRVATCALRPVLVVQCAHPATTPLQPEAPHTNVLHWVHSIHAAVSDALRTQSAASPLLLAHSRGTLAHSWRRLLAGCQQQQCPLVVTHRPHSPSLPAQHLCCAPQPLAPALASPQQSALPLHTRQHTICCPTD
jgi:hypothetical protein